MTNEQLVNRIQSGEDKKNNMLALWQQNKGFIVKMISKYRGYAEADDLMQESYIALCEAVLRYDPKKGAPFINYAALWINQYIQRYINNCCHTVYIPVRIREETREYKKTIREYYQHYGYEPSEGVLCTLLGVESEKLHTIQKNAKMEQIESINQLIFENAEDMSLIDVLDTGENIEDDCIKAFDCTEMKREVWIALEELPGDLTDTIKYRYWGNMTLEQTGKKLGIDRKQAAGLERRAFKILRKGKRGMKLRRYCEEYISAASTHHVGVESFKRTWTSEVERAVLRC